MIAIALLQVNSRTGVALTTATIAGAVVLPPIWVILLGNGKVTVYRNTKDDEFFKYQ
ncbi:hypothetical protein BN2497_10113 [Janthinobacterium sp. CG23_2]|nr:hypothetical protein BN2497_10113 [Janthinobacterium sp. CG23_2]CUU31454.1 hypothetical protein BN3177_10113 [Janthinobacterium sp. CG23_2]